MCANAYETVCATKIEGEQMKKITVLFGNYGSGKTELSLNMALKAKEDFDKVTLVDLDIVNPYFRSSEHKEMLTQKGIRVVSPVYANTALDLPTLPPEIYTAFGGGYAVFDCGGDAVGAAALGSLKAHFNKHRDDTEILFVVNTNRPFQQSSDEIEDSIARIEKSSRLKADGLVLNSNLGKETTGDDLISGYKILKALSDKLTLPIKMISGTQKAINSFKKSDIEYNGLFFTITPYMRPDWMKNS